MGRSARQGAGGPAVVRTGGRLFRRQANDADRRRRPRDAVDVGPGDQAMHAAELRAGRCCAGGCGPPGPCRQITGAGQPPGAGAGPGRRAGAGRLRAWARQAAGLQRIRPCARSPRSIRRPSKACWPSAWPNTIRRRRGRPPKSSAGTMYPSSAASPKNCCGAGSEPSPLVRAVRSPDRRLRMAALEAIVALQPQAPFAGSSHVLESLGLFGRVDRRPPGTGRQSEHRDLGGVGAAC